MSSKSKSDPKAVAIRAALELIDTRLIESTSIAKEACQAIQRGERNIAIGALVGLDVLVQEVLSLYGAALALHRSTPYATRLRGR